MRKARELSSFEPRAPVQSFANASAPRPTDRGEIKQSDPLRKPRAFDTRYLPHGLLE
jgi:hypothetical protein